jgi:diaminohydroxyphosphoribosylaminopyrimidine deaminase/5-amino-6-(5-phosphoribosylamino)uracil reductase
MRHAIELAHRSPHSVTAFAVGSVIVDADGQVITEGYSRDDAPHVHAEESALLKAAGDPRLTTATLYSTLEPCTDRRTRPHTTCASLIIAAKVPRVVIAWREPDIFVNCEGVAVLTQAGVEVIELPDLAPLARRANAHLGL